MMVESNQIKTFAKRKSLPFFLVKAQILNLQYAF